MDRQGRVHQRYEDGTALVLCTDHCAMECEQCGGCGRLTEGLIAQNPEGAQLGELVLVRAHPEKVMLAAFMLLILPIIGFLGGYRLGNIVFGTGKVTGLVGLAISICVGLVYDRRIASKPGSGYTLMKYPQNINKGDNRFD